LERYNRWFWLQSVKTELELGLIFGTDSRIGTGNFFKFLFERTRARTRFQVTFMCGTGIRIGIDILQKHLEKKLELKG
jgi:hypothetical protein